MLRKHFLATAAFLPFLPAFAEQETSPHQGVPHHMATTHPHTMSHPALGHCPCPSPATGGWLVIPTGPMTGNCDHTGGHPSSSHHSSGTPSPHHTPHHPSPASHPGEEPAPHDAADAQLQTRLNDPRNRPHIYMRANKNSPDPAKKEGEHGKEWEGKVYFKEFGRWIHDPSVRPEDKIETGVQAKRHMLAEALKRNQPATQPHPRRTDRRKAHPQVSIPDALGTTARPNTVYTNPTENNERQFSQGAPNRAQTNLMGATAEPETSPTSAPGAVAGAGAPPPPPPPPPPAR